MESRTIRDNQLSEAKQFESSRVISSDPLILGSTLLDSCSLPNPPRPIRLHSPQGPPPPRHNIRFLSRFRKVATLQPAVVVVRVANSPAGRDSVSTESACLGIVASHKTKGPKKSLWISTLTKGRVIQSHYSTFGFAQYGTVVSC